MCPLSWAYDVDGNFELQCVALDVRSIMNNLHRIALWITESFFQPWDVVIQIFE